MRMDIVEAIHDHGKTGKRWFATLNRRDHKFHEWNDLSEEQWLATDVYFAPGRFHGKRKNINLATLNLLWADLDDSFHHERLEQIRPSYLWETSPDNLQAVWFLTEPYAGYARWAEANQGLTYWLGADKGGWHGSKLLRVPGTVNWKRYKDGSAPVGEVWGEHPYFIYDAREVWEKVAKFAAAPIYDPTDTMPDPETQEECDRILVDWWPNLSMSTKAALHTPPQHVTDRSMHIIRTTKGLKNDGVPADTAFHLLMYRPWNKYRMRMPELWKVIMNVYDGK